MLDGHGYHPASRVLAWIDARRWWLCAAALVFHAASFSGVWRVGPDSAIYLDAARGVVEGRGLVANEGPYTHGFAGFPILLAWVERAFGSMIAPGVAVTHAAGLLSVVMVFLLMQRHAGRAVAVLVTFLFAVNANLVRHCGELLADVPFLLGSSAALLGYELTFARPGERDAVRRGVLAAALLLGGVALMASMRIVVAVVLAALAVDLLWRCRRGRAKWAALATCAAVAGIALVVRLNDPRMSDGWELLPKERYLLESVTNMGLRLDRVAGFTFGELALRVTPGAMLGNRVGVWPVDLVITVFVFAAGVALVRRRVAWGVVVALCLVQWLLFYPDARYFLPVLPLLILGWWDAAGVMAARLSLRGGRRLMVATAAVLAGPNMLRDVGHAIEQHRTPFLASYQGGRYEGVPELAERIASQTPPELVIVADEKHAGPLHYWSRRRTLSLIEGRDLEPVPQGRPLAVLLPASEALVEALAASGLEIGEATLSQSRSGREPLEIATLRRR
ncbi:MAG TPA: hypothetical protein VF777_03425 [Phycisphaerales bacterium]